MPQNIETYIPFPSRISRDVMRAGKRHLEWPLSFGLLHSRHARQRHAQGLYPELAGRFYPSAIGLDLDLGVDQLSWFFVFDDHFDTEFGATPEPARQLTEAVAAVLENRSAYPTATASVSPLIDAFADIWSRSCEGMSPAWRARAAENWRRYLAGHVIEAANRETSSVPSLSNHLAVRANTIGVFPILDLAERLGHFEICERAYESGELTEMRLIAAEVVALDNEIFSLEKEESIGDQNLILTIESDCKCSRAEAIKIVCDMIKERVERFLTAQQQFPELCARLDLSAFEQANLSRYLSEAVQAVMRGAHDWSLRSLRYTTSYLPQEESLSR